MHEVGDQKSLQGYARFAGFMYVFSMAVFIAYFAITGGFVVKGDFLATAAKIAASEHLYRIGLACLLLGSMTIFGIGWGFYCLLKPVSPNLALLALLWRAAEAAVVGVGAVVRFGALDNYLAAPSDAGARALAGQLMSSTYGASYFVGQAYLCAGSLIFFYLLFRTRFIPRPFAAFCFVASALLLLQTFAHLIVPEQASVLGLWENLPMFITEVGTGLWLLIRGADFRWWNDRAARAAPSVPS